jgi:hypothetical protein
LEKESRGMFPRGAIVTREERAIVGNPRNIYILNEIGKEKFCFGKEDEVWIWHRRMGHINFDNIVNVSKKEEVKEIPQIMKPTNTL